MKLKNLTYTGRFEVATCGLAHPFKEGFAVGCGKLAKLELFEHTLEDGKTRSTVALCPACAARQMTVSRRKSFAEGRYILLNAEGSQVATIWRYDKGWACRVWVAGERHTGWARTLAEAEADALVWYRFFTKGVV